MLTEPLKRIVQRSLASRGFELVRTSDWERTCKPYAEVDVLVDVGAAFGTPEFYEINRRAHLMLVEPLPVYGPALGRIRQRRDSTVIAKAVGSRAGTLELNYRPDEPTKSSAGARVGDALGESEVFAVDVTTLDTILADHVKAGRRIGVKIDTEGHEIEVLRGATKSMPNIDFFVVETSLLPRFVNGYTFDDCHDLMALHGYSVAGLVSAKANASQVIPHCDVLFARKR